MLVIQDRAEEAQPLLEHARAFDQRTLGTNHRKTLSIEYWLGLAYEKQGRVDEAADLFSRVHTNMLRYLPQRQAHFVCDGITNFFARHPRHKASHIE